MSGAAAPAPPPGRPGAGASRERVHRAVIGALEARASRLGLALGTVDGDLDVLGSGIVDSLGFVDLLLEVEVALGRPIDLERLDFDRLDRLDALVDQLHALQTPLDAG